jgi:hypothetical protein
MINAIPPPTPTGDPKALKLFDARGCPLDKQRFTWRDMVQKPISKLDDDAYTRVRIILLNGLELEALRFQHACARMNRELQPDLAQVRRIEQHQATTVNWLLGADHSPLETTIAYEQVAIDMTAGVAMREPDPYLTQVYRFGLLEDFDHMHRYSALLDRLEGKDANNILQSYTDILPGRPAIDEHRHPLDDLRAPYDRATADPLSKLHALTIMAPEQQTHNYYMNVGLLFTDRWRASCMPRSPPSRSSTSRSTSRSSTPTRAGLRSGCCTRPPRSTTATVRWSRRATRASRRCGNASSTTSWANCTT